MLTEDEHDRLSDEDILELAESWILAEVRRCQRKLGLTPLQLFQVTLKVTGRISKSFIESIKDDDEVKP